MEIIGKAGEQKRNLAELSEESHRLVSTDASPLIDSSAHKITAQSKLDTATVLHAATNPLELRG